MSASTPARQAASHHLPCRYAWPMHRRIPWGSKHAHGEYMNALLSHAQPRRAPGLPLSALVFISVVCAGLVWASPRVGIAVALLFSAYWSRLIIRSERTRSGIDLPHRAPRFIVAAECWIIFVFQLR